MNEGIQKSYIGQNSKNSGHVWDYSLMDIDVLTTYISREIKDIYRSLGPCLPGCVYQLKLYNDLLKQGFQLKTEKAILNDSPEQDVVRSLIIVNNILVIEYIAEDNMSDINNKRIKFDLKNNHHERGLLINIAEGKNSIGIMTVNKNQRHH